MENDSNTIESQKFEGNLKTISDEYPDIDWKHTTHHQATAELFARLIERLKKIEEQIK